jgi:YggT family protein
MYAAPCGSVKNGGFAHFPRAPCAAIDRVADLAREQRMNPFLWLVTTLITLYIWIIIASAVLSWLVAFNVVNPHNSVVRAIGETLYRLTEPALRPIRSMLPSLGGLDISPVILIIILLFIERLLFWAFS